MKERKPPAPCIPDLCFCTRQIQLQTQPHLRLPRQMPLSKIGVVAPPLHPPPPPTTPARHPIASGREWIVLLAHFCAVRCAPRCRAAGVRSSQRGTRHACARHNSQGGDGSIIWCPINSGTLPKTWGKTATKGTFWLSQPLQQANFFVQQANLFRFVLICFKAHTNCINERWWPESNIIKHKATRVTITITTSIWNHTTTATAMDTTAGPVGGWGGVASEPECPLWCA